MEQREKLIKERMEEGIVKDNPGRETRTCVPMSRGTQKRVAS
jgi:hypothetical protein